MGVSIQPAMADLEFEFSGLPQTDKQRPVETAGHSVSSPTFVKTSASREDDAEGFLSSDCLRGRPFGGIVRGVQGEKRSRSVRHRSPTMLRYLEIKGE